MNTVKKCLTLIIALFTTFSLLGQTRFIPSAGLNASYFAEDLEDDKVTGKVGWQAGFDLRFGQSVYVQPGVHYFQRNARLERIGPVNTTDLDYDFRLEGFRFPLYVGGDLFSDENLGLRLYGGPSLILLVNNDDQLAEVEDFVLQDNLWTLNAGAGLDFGIFTVDLQHEWGLTNVFTTDALESRNNVVYLSVGILF